MYKNPIKTINKITAAAIRPDPVVSFCDWADQNFVLGKDSLRPGKYRTDTMPYVKEILYELSPESSTQEIVVQKPTQVGFTTLAIVSMCAEALLYPAPTMIIMPSMSLAVDFSKTKLQDSINANKKVKALFPPKKSRASSDTLYLKVFRGGSWRLKWAGSSGAARSASIRYLKMDDVDGWPLEVADEGNTLDKFKARTDGYGDRRKIYVNSTPTVKGFSHIEIEYNTSSQGVFLMHCPKCGHMQYLTFGDKDLKYGIKFDLENKQVGKIWYVCKNCHCERSDAEWKNENNFVKGFYKHGFESRLKRGFKMNGLYSPLGFYSWRKFAQDFVDCGKNIEKLKTWTNNRKAEVFDIEGKKVSWQAISNRAERYKHGTIPHGVLFLVAGVDTQDDRLVMIVLGFGRNSETWLIYYEELFGDPSGDACWNQLALILKTGFTHQNGKQLFITDCAIDTAGHKTQYVYNYVRTNPSRIFGIKGALKQGAPPLGKPNLVDVNYAGQKIKNGFMLWPVGTHMLKELVYSKLAYEKKGPNYVHFPEGLPDDFYKQLCSQKLVVHKVNGIPRQKYVEIYDEDHVLDGFVYAHAAAEKVGYNSPYFAWGDLERYINSEPKEQKKPAKPKRSQVVKSPYLR